jgi:hypothetical protein
MKYEIIRDEPPYSHAECFIPGKEALGEEALHTESKAIEAQANEELGGEWSISRAGPTKTGRIYYLVQTKRAINFQI